MIYRIENEKEIAAKIFVKNLIASYLGISNDIDYNTALDLMGEELCNKARVTIKLQWVSFLGFFW